MRDRRGFRYQLEPVQRLCEWELNDMATQLADLNRAVDAHAHQADQLAREAEAVRTGWARHAAAEPLNLELRQITYRYMAQLDARLAQGRARLGQLEQERDRALIQTQMLRKFSDNLDEHREQALGEHERRRAEHYFKDADDIWLQRMNWRRQQ